MLTATPSGRHGVAHRSPTSSVRVAELGDLESPNFLGPVLADGCACSSIPIRCQAVWPPHKKGQWPSGGLITRTLRYQAVGGSALARPTRRVACMSPVALHGSSCVVSAIKPRPPTPPKAAVLAPSASAAFRPALATPAPRARLLPSEPAQSGRRFYNRRALGRGWRT